MSEDTNVKLTIDFSIPEKLRRIAIWSAVAIYCAMAAITLVLAIALYAVN